MKLRAFFRRGWAFLLDCLFVPSCPICSLPEQEEICSRCRKKMEELFDPWPVIRDRMNYDGAYSAFCFSEEPVKNLVYHLKFKGLDRAVALSAEALYHILNKNVTFSAVDVITWVPRSKKNVLEYGFDQSLLLAQALSKKSGIPCRPLLYRKRDNQIQHKLSREKRLTNVKDCFACKEKVFCGDVLLIDDVVTSGATVNEAARILKKSGYDTVRVLSLASTDKRTEK